MNEPLILYCCGWSSPRNDMFFTLRHPPVPAMVKYWYMGGDGNIEHYVGLVAVPRGVDPMTVVLQEFQGAVSRDMTYEYILHGPNSDRYPISEGDWDLQRLAYFSATGQLYHRPVVGHYDVMPDLTWWCTTNIEFFDL